MVVTTEIFMTRIGIIFTDGIDGIDHGDTDMAIVGGTTHTGILTIQVTTGMQVTITAGMPRFGIRHITQDITRTDITGITITGITEEQIRTETIVTALLQIQEELIQTEDVLQHQQEEIQTLIATTHL